MATRTQIYQVQVLDQKYPFLGSTRIWQNGPFQKSSRLARLADIRQAVLQGLARPADIRRGHFWEKCDIRSSGHCLIIIQIIQLCNTWELE